MRKQVNLDSVTKKLEAAALKLGVQWLVGVTPFETVYNYLLPVQKTKLLEIIEKKLGLMKNGNFISIAFSYPEKAIDSIAINVENGFDVEAWGYYSNWYDRLNIALNETSADIAHYLGGISIPPTLTGISNKIEHVEDYYDLVVSHRVAAELSGIGWKGKNELIINPKFSCAIRLASIITEIPLEYTNPIPNQCGNCRACLDVCPFLANKKKLDNYREQCRKYILSLKLDHEVCGKCIKACYREGVHKNSFKL
jgi:epoxyqueuosine reductase QueG